MRLLPILVLASLASFCAGHSKEQWCREVPLQGVESIGDFQAFRLDAAGDPKVALLLRDSRNGPPEEYFGYLCKTGDSWTLEKIADHQAGTFAPSCSMALSSSGEPYVLYLTGPSFRIQQARRGPGGVWTSSPVGPDIPAAAISACAGPSNDVHFAWFRQDGLGGGLPNLALFHGRFSFDDDSLVTERLLPFQPPLGFDDTAIACGADDVPHIVIGNAGKLIYYTKNGNLWDEEFIDDRRSGPTGPQHDVVVDAQGRVSVVYLRDNEPGVPVSYALRGAGGWNLESVYDTRSEPKSLSLCVDAQDRPRIAIQAADSEDLFFHHDGTSWCGAEAFAFGGLGDLLELAVFNGRDYLFASPLVLMFPTNETAAVLSGFLPDFPAGDFQSVELQAAGPGPLDWDRPEYLEIESAEPWGAFGSQIAWDPEETERTVNLPFPFPFFGEVHSQAIVQRSGGIQFPSALPIPPFIHGFGGRNLDEDVVFLDSGPGRFALRWRTSYTDGLQGDARWGMVLEPDGRVHFVYGPGNATGAEPQISPGGNLFAASISSSHRHFPDLHLAPATALHPPAALPPGLQFVNGFLWGRPTVTGETAFACRVIDDCNNQAGKILTLRVTPNDADNDTLPDSWELRNGLDPGDDGSVDPDNGPNGNPDGDPRSNAEEFVLDSSAQTPDELLALERHPSLGLVARIPGGGTRDYRLLISDALGVPLPWPLLHQVPAGPVPQPDLLIPINVAFDTGYLLLQASLP